MKAKPAIAHATIPPSTYAPPPLNVASAVLRAAVVDVQDDFLMACSDFSARTGLQIVRIDVGHTTRSVRNFMTKSDQLVHDYQINVCVRLPA